MILGTEAHPIGEAWGLGLGSSPVFHVSTSRGPEKQCRSSNGSYGSSSN